MLFLLFVTSQQCTTRITHRRPRNLPAKACQREQPRLRWGGGKGVATPCLDSFLALLVANLVGDFRIIMIVIACFANFRNQLSNSAPVLRVPRTGWFVNSVRMPSKSVYPSLICRERLQLKKSFFHSARVDSQSVTSSAHHYEANKRKAWFKPLVRTCGASFLGA